MNFSGVKIFESATVDTHILLLSKEKNQGKTFASVLNKSNKDQLNSLETFVSEHSHLMNYYTADKWVILTNIEYKILDRIKKKGHSIADWHIKINFGIKTGNNDAFIIDTATKDLIISNCKTEDERQKTIQLIRSILRGRDITRFRSHFADKWLLNIHNGVKNKVARINIDEYPSLKKHLDNYYPALVRRADKGDTPYNLRNCAYLFDFDKPKILWKRIGSILRFSYDDTGIIGLDSTCFATGDHLEVLCCILNSKLGHYMLKDSPRTGTGDLLISVQAVEPLLVPNPTPVQESSLISLLDSQMQNVTDENDAAIADIVYEMYGMNDPEMRNYIDNYEL